jgi:hypothetical protein
VQYRRCSVPSDATARSWWNAKDPRRTRSRSLVQSTTKMAVYHLFRNKAFEPEAIAAMTSAYDDVCRLLGLEDPDDPETNAVARKIIEFAQRGERDPVRLRESVLRSLGR